jgi:hypothetical protein
LASDRQLWVDGGRSQFKLACSEAVYEPAVANHAVPHR